MRALLCCLLVGLSLPAGAQNVLARQPPMRSEGLNAAFRMTDQESPVDGDAWDGPAAVVLAPIGGPEWDLGEPRPMASAVIQADNNDVYLLFVSDDGVTWREFARFPAVEGGGLRTRTVNQIPTLARFVRLTAEGGDGRYSVSELELFSGAPSGSTLLRARWVPRRPLEQQFIVWVVLATLVVLFASRRLPRLLLIGLGVLGLSSTAWLVFDVTPQTPGFLVSLPWIRAAVALVGLAAVIRERLWTRRWPASTGFVLGTLSVTAAMATWCFLNLGTPQFHDASQGRGTWLHHYDMRTYFPIAKYFPELRFDGVYAASVLAVADGRDLSLYDAQPLRDLRTHALTTVGESKAHLLEVRSRFTPERWAMFLEDMTYFRRAMSDGGFLGSMSDHGGNATPVWFLGARALFAGAPASDATLWRGVIADIALLVIAFVALWWAWGPRTALLAVTVFGAMDFYQFGSNWFGAALRHDWLALWAIGLALLHKKRWAWAGAVLAWSAWIRAFPALTFLTMSLPAVVIGGWLVLRGRGGEAWKRAQPLVRVTLGVLAASVVLVGLSVVIFGADAWVEWLRKVQTLDRDNHVNNISFRTYVNTDKQAWVMATLGGIVALGWMLRRASLERAAAWGVALLPVVFNPANYYMHSAFLLVTLASEAKRETVPFRGVLTWSVLLLMCAASYLTNVGTDLSGHFRDDTWICFTALGALYVLEWFRPRES